MFLIWSLSSLVKKVAYKLIQHHSDRAVSVANLIALKNQRYSGLMVEDKRFCQRYAPAMRGSYLELGICFEKEQTKFATSF